MDYSKLVNVYREVGNTSKRLEKTEIISNILKDVDLEEIEEFMLLLQGKIYPTWSEKNTGIASKTIIKSISSSFGCSQEEVISAWKKIGDLGDACEVLHNVKKQSNLFSKKLTIKKVLSNFRKLSEISGGGSINSKILLLSELISSASLEEVVYIVRTAIGDLRIGIAEGVVRDSIVWAFFPRITGINSEETGEIVTETIGFKDLEEKQVVSLEKKENARILYNRFVEAVQRVFDLTNDFAYIVKKIKDEGLDSLKDISITPGKPFNVMLAIANTVEGSLESVGTPARIEFKYDGFRVQIHKSKDEVFIFTRKLENVTSKFPDIVKVIKNLNVESIILDTEVVGFDKDTKEYLPFQKVSQRINRKHDVVKVAKEFPVEINVFDILYLNNKSLQSLPLSERLEILKGIIPKSKDNICIAEGINSSTKEEVMDFFKQAMDKKTEGIMIKSLSASYSSGRKVGFMFKYKESLENLDVVIIGGEWGKGKRANWISSLDIAIVSNGELLDVGKVGTGIKEKSSEGVSFEQITELLKPLIISEDEKHISVTPKVVIEVEYEEIQKSPNYSSGFALRFPRFVRLRPDKPVREITTLDYIKNLFSSS